MSTCACSECRDTSVTREGYCSFCSSNCFPLRIIAGQPQRTAFSPAARAQIHTVRVSSASSNTQKFQEQLVNHVIDNVTPIVQKGAKNLLEAARRRLMRSR